MRHTAIEVRGQTLFDWLRRLFNYDTKTFRMLFQARTYSWLIVDAAKAEIGAGESVKNNWGPDVIRFRRGDGTGLNPNTTGAWCASFVSYCMTRAAAFQGATGTVPWKTSRGAKRLRKNMLKSGHAYEVDVPQKGDIIFWDRSKKGQPKTSWWGHAGIVISVEAIGGDIAITTVEGNKGKYPALVREYTYIHKRIPRLIGYVRIGEKPE